MYYVGQKVTHRYRLFTMRGYIYIMYFALIPVESLDDQEVKCQSHAVKKKADVLCIGSLTSSP